MNCAYGFFQPSRHLYDQHNIYFLLARIICKDETSYNKKTPPKARFYVVPSGETANKFNEHLELILDFMGVLEHEPELWERIKSAETTEAK